MRIALLLLLLPLLLLPILPLTLSQPTTPSPNTTTPSPFLSPSPPQLAPLFPALRPFTLPSPSNLTLPLHRYIIVLHPTTSPTNLTSLLTSILPPNTSAHQLFIGPPTPLPPSFNAFSAFLTAAQLQRVRASPYVEYVEEDGLVSLDYDLTGMQVLREGEGMGGGGEEGIEQVGGSRARNPYYSWGLDRIVSTSRGGRAGQSRCSG